VRPLRRRDRSAGGRPGRAAARPGRGAAGGGGGGRAGSALREPRPAARRRHPRLRRGRTPGGGGSSDAPRLTGGRAAAVCDTRRRMASRTIVVMEGDQTGQELLEEALRVLDPAVTGLGLTFERHDLSLENRRRTKNQVVVESAEAMRRHGYGLKAATITPEGAGDVGSPNALLRQAIDGKVIIRTGRRLSGVRPLAGIHAPISIVRMAVDDAYSAREHREGEGDDEVAWRVEHISRRTCRAVAEFAFLQARKMNATVAGG